MRLAIVLAVFLPILFSETSWGQTFHNAIVLGGFCGAGRENRLVNHDRTHRYRVTVTIGWHQGVKSGSYQKEYDSEAGGDQLLGCSWQGTIPETFCTYSVAGEVPYR